jgi:hypothetical protein
MATTADNLVTEAQEAYEDAKAIANSASEKASNALWSAQNAVNGISTVNVFAGGYDPQDAVVNAIAVPAIPTTDFSTDVREAFDYAFGQFNDDIQPQIINYLDAFFPDIAEAIKTDSDDWIINTIANGRFVPIDVENALWNRARDKEIQESLRQERSIIEATAARGFNAPNGVLTYTIAANQQETSKRLTAINREIAIKAFDVMNENTKFAIQQAVGLRTAFVGALGDFIKTAMAQPNQANDYAKLILTAKSGLYDSAVNLYRAKISEEQMRTSVALENRGLELKSSQLLVDSVADVNKTQIAKANVQANTAIQAAESLSKIAAAAYATRNSMISVSAGV